MKTLLRILQTILLALLISHANGQYCIPYYSTGCEYYDMGITYFGLNTISETIPCSGTPSYYQDFTYVSTDLALNGYYVVSVNAGGEYEIGYTVWIDYDQSGVFDPYEMAGQGYCDGLSTSTLLIQVDGFALTGPTTLRVMSHYFWSATGNYPEDPCSLEEEYGNCADFTVNLIDAVTPPDVTTAAATGVTTSDAVLNGNINANGYDTYTEFHYGETDAYGYTVPGVPGMVTGSTPTGITANIYGLMPNTEYHFMAAGYGPGGYITGEDMTFTTSGITLSLTTTQTETSQVFAGGVNQQIIGIEILNPVPFNPVEVTSFTFNTNGCTQLSDLINAKLYYTGTTGTFSPVGQFGSTVTGFGTPGSSFIINGSQNLSDGANYFWLTYDISPTATGGNYVDAECTSVVIGGDAMTPDVTAPAGNRQINDTKNLAAIIVTQASTTDVYKGSVDNEILALDFLVGGTTGTLTLNSIVVTNTGYDTDIASGGVKLYRTDTPVFSTANPLGTAQSFSSLTATFNALAYNLPTGHTYIWITFDIAGGAAGYHLADAKLNTNSINVNGNLYPVSDQNPTGSRMILPSVVTLPLMESAWNTIPPYDWNKVGNSWTASSTNYAGGTSKELRLFWNGAFDGDKMYTPPINTAGLSYLVLRFKYLLDDYRAGCTLRVQSSSNGSTWTNEAWSRASIDDQYYGPYDVVTPITSNLSEGRTYVAFTVTGYPENIDNWFIDNVKITGPEPPTVATTAVSDISQTGATSGGNVTDDAANPVTARGVCWSRNPDPTLADPHTTDGAGLGTFISTISGLTPGTPYHVRAYATNGIGTSYGADLSFTSLAVTIYDVTGGGSYCPDGDGLPVGLNGSDAGIDYQLYKNAVAIGSPIPGTGNPLNFGNQLAGTYTVKGTVSGVTQNMNGNAVIIAFDPPVPSIIGDDVICGFPSATIQYATETGKTGYAWTVSPGGTVMGGGGSGDYYIDVRWDTQGEQAVSVSYTDSHGCTAANPTVMIVNVYEETIPDISGNNLICGVPSPGNLYMTNPGMNNYIWTITGGGETITSGGGTSDNTVTLTWNSPGNKTVQVMYTNPGGCSPASPGTLNVVVNEPPAITIAGDNTVCEGDFVTLTSAVTNGGINPAYDWYVNGLLAGHNPTLTYTPVDGDQVQCVIWVSQTECWTSYSATSNMLIMVVTPLPVPTLTGPTSVCNGSSDNLYWTTSGMTNYQWTIPTGATVMAGGGTADHTLTLKFTSVGTKIIKVNYTDTYGCMGAEPTQLIVTVKPSPVPLITGPTTCCVNQIYTYSTTPFQTNYVWEVSPGDVITSGQGTKLVKVQWLSTGTRYIKLSYTGANGCPAVTPTTKVVWVNTCKTDFLGHAEDYSSRIEILENSMNRYGTPDLNLYPNPNEGSFTVVVTVPQENTYTMQMFSNLGVMVYELRDIRIDGKLRKTIHVRNLADGVYNFVVFNQDQMIHKRVVIRKR